MHFKENEIVKDGLQKIENHFDELAKKELTQESLLGFKKEKYSLYVNTTFISKLQSDFDSISTVNDDISKTITDNNSIEQINQFTDVLRKPYFQLDDTQGVIDKRLVNGQLSIYKEWVDFAKKHEVSPKYDVNELKIKLNESAVFFKKSSLLIKDLNNIIKEISDNKRNTRYVKALLNDFKEVYSDKVESSMIFRRNLNKNISQYENILFEIGSDIENIKEEIKKKSPDTMLTMANKFCNSQSVHENEISNFLKAKDFEDLIEVRIQLKGQLCPDNILFKDGSYAYAEKGQYLHTISRPVFYEQLSNLYESSISHLSRKKPKIASFFKRYLEEETALSIIPVLDTYQQYGDIISRSGLNILEIGQKSLEVVDDKMNAIVLEHKTNQYVSSILSKKYEHLLSDEARDMLKILYESGVTQKSLQEYIGKKIAALKTPEEFLDYVTRVKDHFSGFSPEALSSKLEGNGIVPCYDKDGVVIFNVDSFDISKTFGSASWCIARDDYYFESYTDGNSRQYFIYDFNEKESSNKSMIGVTLKPDGTVRASHLKNDDDFRFLDQYSELHLEILKNDFKEFKLNEEYSKIMKDKYNISKDVVEKENSIKYTGPKI